MNLKKYVFATAALFVFTFLYEWLLHGNLLMDLYNLTPELWRPEPEMKELLPFAMGRQLFLSAVVAFIFTRGYEGKGLGEGLRFGLYIGLLFGIMMGGSYTWSPISCSLSLAWFVGGLIQGLGSGLVLSLTYSDE